MDLSILHKLVLERCSADHKCAGVELDKDPVAFEEAANQRRTLGRYTIEEAALFIAIEGPANYESIMNEILDSIALGDLNSYEPGRNGVYRNTFITHPATLEVYDSDMNAWLIKKQHRIGAIFPVVSVLRCQSESTAGGGGLRHIKQRTNALDHIIERAIEEAGPNDHYKVYFVLTEMILQGADVLPFTGEVGGDGLVYRDLNDKEKKLTPDALRQRMKRRSK